MPQDPFDPFAQGQGNAQFRKLNRLSSRTPEEFERDHEIRELRRERRRAFLRRIFRRSPSS